MAEVVGLVASIIAVIQLTGKVTSLGYVYFQALKRAPKDLGELVNELGSLTKVLTTLQDIADKNPQLAALQTLNSRNGPLEGISAELKKLVSKLEPRKGFKGTMDNLKWPLKEADTMQHISRIERCKSLFDLALTTDQISLSINIERNLQDTSRGVQEIQRLAQNTSLTVQDINNLIQTKSLTVQDIEKLLENNHTLHDIQNFTRQSSLTAYDTQTLMRNTNLVIQDIKTDMSHASLAIKDLQTRSVVQPGGSCTRGDISRKEEKRREVLMWLSLDDFDRKHVEISNRRQPNTGKWIMRTPQFQGWINRGKDRRLLWGCGIPGAGKTFLSSSIIDHLQTQSVLEKYGVAHIYFDYKEESRQTPAYVLASLVKQLAYQIPDLPGAIEDLHNKREPEGKRPTIEELYSVLLSTTKSFPHVFLLFDALDEYNQENKRGELLELFHRMCEPGAGISVFLTSRPHPEDIQDSLRDATRIEILAKEDDIRTYIREKINKSPRAKRLVHQANLCETIISELVDCAQGMFLLVHFHIEYLCQQTTKKQILMALKGLKSSASEERPLDPTYDRAMESIRRQNRGCITLAFKIFSWLVKARRTLTVDEIRVAVSVEQELYELDEEDLLDRTTILDICAGLVIIDENNMTVQLAHYTVQDYLLRTSAVPKDAEFQVAMACTTYLSFDIFAEGACTSNQSLKTRNQSYPFFDYAVHQLPAHLKACSEDLSTDMVLRFVRCPGNISAYLQALHFPANLSKSSGYDSYPKGRSPLHVAAALGHSTVVKLLLDGGISISVLDNQRKTALHVAAFEGQEATTRLLLGEGADPSLSDHYDQTALHIAASQGHMTVARLLLEKGVDTSIPDSLGYTALHNAAFEKHLEIIQLLIDYGANASAQKNSGRTALHTAVYQGNEAVARLLLANGSDISLLDNNGLTALHLAMSRSSETMIQLLIENGASPYILNRKGQTVLDIAASRWDENLIRVLVENGVRLPIPINTILHTAVLKGSLELVRLLLESGADHSTPGKNGRTALHMAVSKRNSSLELVQLLLQKGADHSTPDKDGRTALHMAVSKWSPSLKLVQLLLQKGADHSTPDKDGRTALHMAVSKGYLKVVYLLLESGADHSTPDKDGRAALHMAVSEGYLDFVQLLLESGADHSTPDKDGRTALHMAVSKGYLEVVQLLLDNGADHSVPDKDGRTALHMAVSKGYLEVVHLLERSRPSR